MCIRDRFISSVQFVVNYWMVHHGFSCGIGDTVADPDTMNRINTIISEAKESVQDIIRQYQGGALEEKPGRHASALPTSIHHAVTHATIVGDKSKHCHYRVGLARIRSDMACSMYRFHTSPQHRIAFASAV